jgi:hypothetical protein
MPPRVEPFGSLTRLKPAPTFVHHESRAVDHDQGRSCVSAAGGPAVGAPRSCDAGLACRSSGPERCPGNVDSDEDRRGSLSADVPYGPLDGLEDDRLGRAGRLGYRVHRRHLRPCDGRVDLDRHGQCSDVPPRPHGHLDGLENDHLGRADNVGRRVLPYRYRRSLLKLGRASAPAAPRPTCSR